MNLTRSFERWRRYRRTCDELSRLPERELAELGLARDDIPVVARAAIR